MMNLVEDFDEKSVRRWITFSNISNSYTDRSGLGVNLYLEPEMLEKSWRRPDAYIQSLKNYCAVLSPPFPIIKGDPLAVQIYNLYRNHWMGAYWQQNGIKVIPTVMWGGVESYEWCFSSVIRNSVVAVSSDLYRKDKERFLNGFREMCRTIRPVKILWFGSKVFRNAPPNTVYCT